MHIMSLMTQSVSRPRRREHSKDFKRKLVELSLIPGASVAAIALEHGINANLLFGWRKLHMRSLGSSSEGRSAGALRPALLPVEVVAPTSCVAPGAATASGSGGSSGSIEIEVAGARVRVLGTVDEASLRSVVAALRA